MSTNTDNSGEWSWQGFFGPIDIAIAAKVLTDADPRAGVWVPPQGAPPKPVDISGQAGMFAVQTRVGDPIPCPAGLMEADPVMVGRLVGA